MQSDLELLIQHTIEEYRQILIADNDRRMKPVPVEETNKDIPANILQRTFEQWPPRDSRVAYFLMGDERYDFEVEDRYFLKYQARRVQLLDAKRNKGELTYEVLDLNNYAAYVAYNNKVDEYNRDVEMNEFEIDRITGKMQGAGKTVKNYWPVVQDDGCPEIEVDELDEHPTYRIPDPEYIRTCLIHLSVQVVDGLWKLTYDVRSPEGRQFLAGEDTGEDLSSLCREAIHMMFGNLEIENEGRVYRGFYHLIHGQKTKYTPQHLRDGQAPVLDGKTPNYYMYKILEQIFRRVIPVVSFLLGSIIFIGGLSNTRGYVVYYGMALAIAVPLISRGISLIFFRMIENELIMQGDAYDE
jgi:hypothetical protein